MFSRSSGVGMSYIAYEKLWRLAGADHMHVNRLQNKFCEAAESVIASARACLAPMFSLPQRGCEVMPVFSSGQSAKQVPHTFAALSATSLAVSSLLIAALAFSSGERVVVLSSAGFGVLDLTLPAAWRACVDIGRAHAGVVSAVMNSAGLFGGFVCTVWFGYLVRRPDSYRAPIALIGVMVPVSAVLFLCINPAKPLFEEGELANVRHAAV